MIALDLLSPRELERYDHDERSGFGGLSTERGALPLKAMDVRAKIAGLIATTELRQTFVNNLGEALEATYIFPLPDRAAVTRFVMEVAGRVVEGVIKERGQARQDYDRAIAQGQRAAITEEERSGVFTMRVGNIMPGEAATVTLTMTGPLPYDEGEATYRFPLVVAPRYIPGKALGGDDVGDGIENDTDAVPDASRISPPVLLPGYPHPVKLGLEVEITKGTIPAGDLRSSLHAVVEGRDHSGRTDRVRLVPGERLNRDFVLRFRYGTDAIGTSLELSPDAPGSKEGTFSLTVVPPIALSRSTKPREVIFILDRSGSMEGWKMVAARRAVARMVDSLSEKDSFNVYAFDDNIETPTGFPTTALFAASNKNRYQAIEFLAKVDARGGTEMRQPLETAADSLAGGYADKERAMVLVTDGQVGNEDQILRALGSRLKNVKVYTVGIDRAVNEAFLKRLAGFGGGLYELVESEERLDEIMDRMHRRIGTPVVTETSLFPKGLEVQAGSVVPRRLPDLYAGAPITITGRYRGKPEGSLEVRGKDTGGNSWSSAIQGREVDNPAITSVWARGQVRELEDRFVISGGGAAQEKEIVAISIRFSVLCRFTAFVAIDKERVNEGGNLHKVVQPVEAPDGWDMMKDMAKGGGAIAAAAPMKMKKSAGSAGGMARNAPMAKASMPMPPPAAAPEASYGAASRAFDESYDMVDMDDAPAEIERLEAPMQSAKSLADPEEEDRSTRGRRQSAAKPSRRLEQKKPVAGPTSAELERLLDWVEAQEVGDPSDWPSAMPAMVVDLDLLAGQLSGSPQANLQTLGARAGELLAELRRIMAGRRYEEPVVRALLTHVRSFLEEVVRAIQPGSSLLRRLGSFWKT
jgi:Ca-activated chloride channel homolog